MSKLQRRRMLRLVEPQHSTTGQVNRRNRTPPRFYDRAALNAFIGKLFYYGFQIVTHQIQFVMRLFISFCRMSGKLSWRSGKDQPAMSRVNRLEAEHVAQKRADFVCVRG
jgi:hypothetical protein